MAYTTLNPLMTSLSLQYCWKLKLTRKKDLDSFPRWYACKRQDKPTEWALLVYQHPEAEELGRKGVLVLFNLCWAHRIHRTKRIKQVKVNFTFHIRENLSKQGICQHLEQSPWSHASSPGVALCNTKECEEQPCVQSRTTECALSSPAAASLVHRRFVYWGVIRSNISC